MLLNLETDYAIRIVQCLAKNGKLDAKTIASKTGVTPKFTLKILHGLVSADIVKSFKGASGGYALAREPHNITLLEVVEQVYGTLEVSRCNNETCTHPDGLCSFRSVFDDVSKYMRKKFSEITF